MMTIGPLQLAVIAFADPNFQGHILAELDAVRGRGVMRLIDLLFIYRDAAGDATIMTDTDLNEVDLSDYGSVLAPLIGLGNGHLAAVEVSASEAATGLSPEEIRDLVDSMEPNSALALVVMVAISLQSAVPPALAQEILPHPPGPSRVKRTRLAAAIGLILAALGRQDRRQQRETQQPGAASVRESPGFVEANSGFEGEPRSPSPPAEISTRERYLQMWQQFSREVSCSNPAELDFKVGRRAYEAGASQKEIALMLAVGSPTVKQMMQGQRKSQATKYVNRVARLSSENLQQNVQPKATRHHQMEIGN